MTRKKINSYYNKRKLTCIILLLIIISACKKPGGRGDTIPAPIYFVVVDKDGENLIHSLKDSLVVTYSQNGTTVSKHLTIYKVQVSETDTTLVSKYNGFIVSDWEHTFVGDNGYIVTPSGAGVRTFNLFLNGTNLGAMYFDYW